jgi:hypothetical protein
VLTLVQWNIILLGMGWVLGSAWVLLRDGAGLGQPKSEINVQGIDYTTVTTRALQGEISVLGKYRGWSLVQGVGCITVFTGGLQGVVSYLTQRRCSGRGPFGWLSRQPSNSLPSIKLTSSLVSNCNQSPDPVGNIPIVEHFHNPNASLIISLNQVSL